MWLLGKEERGEDFLDDGARLRKGQPGERPSALGLQEVVRDGREDDVMVPAGKRAAFEMIQPEVGLRLAILLLDGPPLMCEPDEPRPRRGGRQVHEVVLGLGRVAGVAFGQQPDLGREPSVRAPGVGRRHAQRGTLDRPLPCRAAVAPTDAPPPRVGGGDGGDRGGLGPHRQRRPGARAPHPRAPWRHEARPPHKDGLRRRDADRVREAHSMQLGAKQAVVAKFRIRQHARHGEATGAHLAEQRQGLTPLLLKADVGRNPRPLPGGVGQPGLRQVQRGPHQVAAQPGPQRRRDGHLTIGDLPQRPTVLAPHPHGVLALFGKARAVEDQQAVALGQDRPQSSPDLVGPPRGIGDEVLERLVGPGLGDARQHRFHRLARAVAEHTLHIPAQRHVLGAMPEALLEGFEPPHQAVQLRNSATVGHCRAAYRMSRKSTMSSKQITRAMPTKSGDLTK